MKAVEPRPTGLKGARMDRLLVPGTFLGTLSLLHMIYNVHDDLTRYVFLFSVPG